MTGFQDPCGRPIAKDYVERLLNSIGLFKQKANKPKLNARSMDLFFKRELAFDWVHMGNSEIRICELIDALNETPFLLPPRTGHIGNWSNMTSGRAGPRDYNHIAFGPRRLGYPLIFDCNQTEAESPGSGDWSYLPGSLVERTRRRILDLFTWDGDQFRRRDRSIPLFTPFTLTPTDEQLVPLTRFHRNVLEGIGDFRFQSVLFARKEKLVRKILYVLLDGARNQNQPEQLLKRVFDRCVTLDGKVTRVALEISGQGFRMGAVDYASAEEVVEHAMLPILLTAQPEDFKEHIRDLPWQMPLTAISLIQMLYSALHSHYPDLEEVPSEMTRPCNPHLHWGGIPMAGYPPQARGYFGSLANYLRKLYRPVVEQLPEVDPALNVLLPAGIFNLCPHDCFPEDVDCLSSLLARVLKDTAGLTGKPQIMIQRIERIVEDWRPAAEKVLSPYMVTHFVTRPGALTSLPAHCEGQPVVLPSFTSLTFQQASMLMSALSQTRWSPDLVPLAEPAS